MKNNILKTFEEFLREPISILKRTIISITGIETAEGGNRTVTVETTDDGKVQINVINSKKAYNLLSCVMYKRQISELRQLINEDKTGKVHSKLAVPQIGTGI